MREHILVELNLFYLQAERVHIKAAYEVCSQAMAIPELKTAKYVVCVVWEQAH